MPPAHFAMARGATVRSGDRSDRAPPMTLSDLLMV
jgi:hypothetical protein